MEMDNIEQKNIQQNQWEELLKYLGNCIFDNAFLTKDEFQTFKNNFNFIAGNISQYDRFPISDYYKALELKHHLANLNSLQSKYKESPKIVQLFQDLSDEIKGERKSNENIQQEKEKLFKEDIKVLNSKYDDVISKLDNFQKINVNQEVSKVIELRKIAEKQQKAIEDMVGTVADNANAGRYIKYANTAKYTANGLFLISISIMLGIAMIALWPLWYGYHIDWNDLLPRVPVFFVVLLPAFFMMREAKKQRDKEFQFKDMECRILTSGQFIDSLELKKSEKDALKAQLVKDLFGKPMEYCPDGGLPPIEQICEIIKACMDRKN